MSAGGAAPAAARMSLEKSGSGAKGDLCAGAFGEVIVSSQAARQRRRRRSVPCVPDFFPVLPVANLSGAAQLDGPAKLTALPISANRRPPGTFATFSRSMPVFGSRRKQRRSCTGVPNRSQEFPRARRRGASPAIDRTGFQRPGRKRGPQETASSGDDNTIPAGRIR